ncbi:putative acyltransferase/oxidoreductase [Sorangium cellulosum So ce56]|uniref:[acyl-carrier-protein] S-malonyltransferase n=2 Tax=Sorangium cellulosum TaxID=56 RepID=A9EWA3_SORC5|nr:ACP S-malonyltransferase [Sorangium cellulosum]AAY89048.1 acyltransferase/oxidoreductase [Sorangium cellulosum]CAN94301.1 putative acyltransferase/oxidoreductase [Sorangium cellulosum So ce56]
MAVFVFPGQGAQRKGMGADLFDRFRRVIGAADEILGYSIKELCLENPDQRLNQTQYTQPALFTINALSYYQRLEDQGVRPAYLAGHSLGEYSALLAAGAFDFETGLLLVKKRGELMSKADKGGMAAVFGLREDDILEALQRHGLRRLHIANHNTPSQIVISGAAEEIQRAKPVFDGIAGARYVPLNVSGAFHSPLMAEAREEFAAYIARFDLRNPGIPVVSNVTARPYVDGRASQLLTEQITSSVQWTDSIRYLMGLGETDFKEIGPGNVLTKLVQQIKQEATPLSAPRPAGAGPEAERPSPVAERPSPAAERPSPAAERPSPVAERPSHAAPRAIAPAADVAEGSGVTAGSLGAASFRSDYRLRYACIAGSMRDGISSKELCVRMGKAGFMGFLGTAGMTLPAIESAVSFIERELGAGASYGVDLPSNPALPEVEEEMVDLYLRLGIRNVEASGYIQLTPALVRFRLKGLECGANGAILRKNRVLAKVSRPEIAQAFCSPAPARIVERLLAAGKISAAQAEMARRLPMADDLTVTADCAGSSDHGAAAVLLPTMIRLRDEAVKQHGYAQTIRIGAAGGIGTPEAALAAFVLGADYIVTGSINQCTVEAGTSDAVKDMLQGVHVQDTDYAPASDMFELGAKVQVLKKGVFFAARANKLYELYRHHGALEEIDEKTSTHVQQKYFKRSFQQVWEETRALLREKSPREIERAERDPKHRMALVFKWYLDHAFKLALRGDEGNKVDFQVYCSPALGAFNQWVTGTELESWRNRHADVIALRLMESTAALLAHVAQRYAPAHPYAAMNAA